MVNEYSYTFINAYEYITGSSRDSAARSSNRPCCAAQSGGRAGTAILNYSKTWELFKITFHNGHYIRGGICDLSNLL